MLAVLTNNLNKIMTIDVTLESDAEEIVLVVDNHLVVKATKGACKGLVLCSNFKNLKNENEDLYHTLRTLCMNLFALED